MKGQPTNRHTPIRHQWLRELADHPGAKRHGKGGPGYACMRMGWTDWRTPGVFDGAEVLTEAGRAQLAEWDRVHGPTAPPAVEPFDALAERALLPGGLEALADWLVATSQAGAMVELLAERARRENKLHVEQPPRPATPPFLGAYGYVQCHACGGRGRVRHDFVCHGCGGTGRVKRTVEA